MKWAFRCNAQFASLLLTWPAYTCRQTGAKNNRGTHLCLAVYYYILHIRAGFRHGSCVVAHSSCDRHSTTDPRSVVHIHRCLLLCLCTAENSVQVHGWHSTFYAQFVGSSMCASMAPYTMFRVYRREVWTYSIMGSTISVRTLDNTCAISKNLA